MSRAKVPHHCIPCKWQLIIITILLPLGWAVAGPRIPWHRRVGTEVDAIHITAHKNTPISLLPEEPTFPAPPNAEKFTAALGRLCGDIPSDRRDKFSRRGLFVSINHGNDF